MTEMAEVKKEEPTQGIKRPAPTENHVFEEEELPIFSKKPKVMYKNPRKKNRLVQKATNGLDSTPKEENSTDPGCSFSASPYSPVTGPSDQKKPKLNYRQLTFLTMKNCNYIPMQTGQICDFIEKVFPYFAQQDHRSKLIWKNALTNAVRTGKCDEGLFTTSSVTGSGLRMFYGMRTDRVEQLEEQIKKWRKQFNKDNFKESGASSFEELDALCNGTMGAESVIGNISMHIERWKKSQLSGSTLEDYDAQERQRAQIKINETDPDKLVLTESEERALAKVASRNVSIVCSICDAKMNTKSFGRHMKGVHGMSQENLLRHRLELQNQKAERQEGFEPDPILCPKCDKQLTSHVMLAVHEQECDGSVQRGQEGSESGSYEDGEDYDQEYVKEEEYDDLNLL